MPMVLVMAQGASLHPAEDAVHCIPGGDVVD